MRHKREVDTFRFAIDGIVHAFRTQRHLRFHFWIVIVALVLARLYRLNRWEMLLLFSSVTMVLVAEMFNTAIEAVIDMVTQTYHPLAKIAKDIAAGAVLIAATNAVVVGLFLFLDEPEIHRALPAALTAPHSVDLVELGTTAALLLLVLILMWKIVGKKGKLLSGGVVSGHAALSFFLFTAICFTTTSLTVQILALALAFLVSQSRVEGKIHTIREVTMGALLGVLVTVTMFRLLPEFRLLPDLSRLFTR